MSEIRNRQLGNGSKPTKQIKYLSKQTEEKNDVVNDGFHAMDIMRMLGGFLILIMMISWFVTDTITWGYETKYTNPRYLKFAMITGHHNFTDSELALYNGTDRQLPVYLAVGGRVYDVTAGRKTYGPGGPYSFFAGRDASRAYVTGCFDQDLTHDLRELDPKEAKHTIEGWQSFYDRSTKYWFVGYVNHGPLLGPPPKPCNGQKMPH